VFKVDETHIRARFVIRDSTISGIVAVEDCRKGHCDVWWAFEARLALPSSKDTNLGYEIQWPRWRGRHAPTQNRFFI
jgi:hypothetical protein